MDRDRIVEAMGMNRNPSTGKCRVMVLTTSRADYGILLPLLLSFKEDPYFELTLVVAGAHLEARYGRTIDAIQKDGLTVSETVRMRPKGDRESDICKAIGRGFSGFSKLFQRNAPDCLIVAGDRYELLAACTAAVIYKIPVAHLHGGELTQGSMDDAFRFAITKMASLHFPSMEAYARRIIQMGEEPSRVHVVGALGIDTITRMKWMRREELSALLGIDFEKGVVLMTYHPVTLDAYHEAAGQVQEILEALMEVPFSVLVTMPNADTAHLQIDRVIRRAARSFPEKFKRVESLGPRLYLNTLRHAKFMIGNSSSGIVESASFRLPVINVGDREGGRLRPRNVIDCECKKEAILTAIHQASSPAFLDSLLGLSNPYGNGGASRRIIEVLKSVDFRNRASLVKKRFHDLEENKQPPSLALSAKEHLE